MDPKFCKKKNWLLTITVLTKKKWMLIFGWNVGAFFRKHIPDFSETAAPKKSMNHERARTKRRSGKKGVKMQ